MLILGPGVIVFALALGCGGVDCLEEATICQDIARAWCSRFFACDPVTAGERYKYGVADCAGGASCSVDQLGCGAAENYQPEPRGCAAAIDRQPCQEFLAQVRPAECQPGTP